MRTYKHIYMTSLTFSVYNGLNKSLKIYPLKIDIYAKNKCTYDLLSPKS